MKTQRLKLDFKTQVLVELNDNQLHNVNGGSSAICLSTAASTSVPCIAVATAAVGIHYAVYKTKQ